MKLDQVLNKVNDALKRYDPEVDAADVSWVDATSLVAIRDLAEFVGFGLGELDVRIAAISNKTDRLESETGKSQEHSIWTAAAAKLTDDQLATAVESLNEDLTTLQERIKEVDDVAGVALENAGKARDELVDQLIATNTSVERLETAVRGENGLNEDIRLLKAQVAAMSLTLRDYDKLIERNLDRVVELEKEDVEISKSIGSLARQSVKQRNDLDELRKSLDELDELVLSQQELIEAGQRLVNLVRTENEDLKDLDDKRATQLEALAEKVLNLGDLATSVDDILAREIVRLDKVEATLDGRLDNAEIVVAGLLQRIEGLDRAVVDLEANATPTEDRMQALERRLNEAEDREMVESIPAPRDDRPTAVLAFASDQKFTILLIESGTRYDFAFWFFDDDDPSSVSPHFYLDPLGNSQDSLDGDAAVATARTVLGSVKITDVESLDRARGMLRYVDMLLAGGEDYVGRLEEV